MNTSKNTRSFGRKLINGFRGLCRGKEGGPFSEANRVELVRLVKSLQTQFINDDKSDRNVYKLDMSHFLGLSIDQQEKLIRPYVYKADGEPYYVVLAGVACAPVGV